MFKKILIANRGEIAIRILRTSHEMEIKTVAIFSEVDRSSPHVLMATEAYPIGPAPSTESYLCFDKILDVARRSKADAVHPGYGFLSENFHFARAVSEAGLAWIGPPPGAMEQMGDKIAARQLALDIGIPVVPGFNRPISTSKEALQTAQRIGFPVLLKAVGGGGGKGMRIVESKKELPEALELAMLEAGSTFSDKRIFMEKYIHHPRHIEIQVVADSHHNCIAMTERECSIQRRYQKIIEESPSTLVNRTLWKQMANHARKIVQQSGYVGAGTVEYLVDKDMNFYFLEMNTRLQVEHPISEMITGVDLVREQIQVAAGEKLSIQDSQLKHRGHAIECRVYAEDGFSNFIPSTGKIAELDVPGGLGIRFDHGMRINQEITPFYDPLLGKLVAWGINRKQAIRRMQRALKECHIVGIETTLPLCYSVLSHQRFVSGNYHTGFLAEELDNLEKINSTHRFVHRNIVSALTAIHVSEQKERKAINRKVIGPRSRWKLEGRGDSLQ